MIKRSATVLRLSDLTFWEWFMFIGGCWQPDRHEGTRWRTWAEYFAAYEQVRDELLAQQRQRWPPLAEFTRAAYIAGKDPREGRAEFEASFAAFNRPRDRQAKGKV